MDIIATANADGTIREYFTRGIGIAGDVGSLVAETRFTGGTTSTVYLHSNWRGDVVMATDSSGAVIGSYDYTTFGEQLSVVGTYTPRFTFSSKESDASGLVYYGFRYYSPVLCRWISEDPIRERGGFNLYQFCGNNPVNMIDPFGLDSSVMEWVHGVLDAGGVADPTPILDGVNALLYAGEGDWSNAGISALGMVPYIGDAGKACKYGGKAFKAGKKAVNTTKNVKKLSNGEILKLKKAGHDIHDLKPKPPSKYDLFKDANGDVLVKPKDGVGPGDYLHININEV
jgi:RHS repeat-associated protein